MNVNVLSPKDVRNLVADEVYRLLSDREGALKALYDALLRGPGKVPASTKVLDSLDLTTRAYNILNGAFGSDITVETLASYSESDLFRLRNSGRRVVREISLKMTLCGWPLSKIPSSDQ
jgi:DNA-directed RNA polymerase alpha subunit